jgi:hypothetical protein
MKLNSNPARGSDRTRYRVRSKLGACSSIGVGFLVYMVLMVTPVLGWQGLALNSPCPDNNGNYNVSMTLPSGEPDYWVEYQVSDKNYNQIKDNASWTKVNKGGAGTYNFPIDAANNGKTFYARWHNDHKVWTKVALGENCKELVCHWDHGQGGKYTENWVSVHSVTDAQDLNGHGQHAKDIWNFWYLGTHYAQGDMSKFVDGTCDLKQTQPPVTEPPVTEPPTAPPTEEPTPVVTPTPPVTEPPATEPPTAPPTEEPTPVVTPTPEITEPPATEPPTAPPTEEPTPVVTPTPEITEPPVTEPPATSAPSHTPPSTGSENDEETPPAPPSREPVALAFGLAAAFTVAAAQRANQVRR